MNPRQACIVLGVTPPPPMGDRSRAEQEKILAEWKEGPLKAAWKKKAKGLHPDAGEGADPEKFKQASEAHQILKTLQLTPEGRGRSEPEESEEPEEEPNPIPQGVRRFHWGPVEITLSAEDQELLDGLGRVLQGKLEKQTAQHEKALRKMVKIGFGTLLDGLMGEGKPPPRAKPRKRRTTTIG